MKYADAKQIKMVWTCAGKWKRRYNQDVGEVKGSY